MSGRDLETINLREPPFCAYGDCPIGELEEGFCTKDLETGRLYHDGPFDCAQLDGVKHRETVLLLIDNARYPLAKRSFFD